MAAIRSVHQLFRSRPTMEGAGVKLKRAFGSPQLPLFDPFLLLDDFHSDQPDDYLSGFPMHPHRGIETITYLLQGRVLHKDSMGHSGVIEAGDVQWMTAGGGIIHEEMPQVSTPELWGFQLWANLPASHKMMAPRYREIRREQIPVVTPAEGVTIRIVCGRVDGVEGPVREIIIDPEFLDVSLAPDHRYDHPVKAGHRVFAYLLEGEARFGESDGDAIGIETVVLFGDGDTVRIAARTRAARLLLISGTPIGEPIAWGGPIVMNTREELARAFEEYRDGTFLSRVKPE
ncbi:MAG TPA: pirin family protein [Nitrospiria bacterium]|nr:pirin family protein [Nitrospiria bacterium]